MKKKKINWKKVFGKSLEDTIKKTIECLMLAILLGSTINTMLFAIPAVTIGSFVAKIIKIKYID